MGNELAEGFSEDTVSDIGELQPRNRVDRTQIHSFFTPIDAKSKKKLEEEQEETRTKMEKVYSLSFRSAQSYRQTGNEITYQRKKGRSKKKKEDFEVIDEAFVMSPPMNLLDSVEGVPYEKPMGFVNLSHNLLQSVISYVGDFDTFFGCLLTCRSLFEFLIMDETTRLEVEFPVHSIPLSVSQHVRKIFITGTSKSPHVEDIKKCFPNVESIRCPCSVFTNNGYNSHEWVSVTLSDEERCSFNLKDVFESQGRLSEFELKSKKRYMNIGEFDLKSDFFHYSITNISMENVKVTQDFMSLVLQRCVNLSRLELVNCGVGDDAIMDLGSKDYLDLTNLLLSRNEITSLGFSEILKKFPNLETLDLARNQISLGSSDISVFKTHNSVVKLLLSRNSEVVFDCGEDLCEFMDKFPNLKFMGMKGCSLSLQEGYSLVTGYIRSKKIILLISKRKK